ICGYTKFITIRVCHGDEMPPTFTHLTDCPAAEGKDMVDGGIDLGNREVKVDTILDRFVFRDALQDEPCRAGERSNGHKLPVGPGETRFLAEQCSPEGRGALDIADVENDLHRENPRWLRHIATSFLLMAWNTVGSLVMRIIVLSLHSRLTRAGLDTSRSPA